MDDEPRLNPLVLSPAASLCYKQHKELANEFRVLRHLGS